MAYFDNAATTFPKPECVYDALDEFNRTLAMNVNRGQYEQSVKAGQIVNETRNLLLQLFNAEGSHKVVFTPSATIAMNMVLQGIDFYGKKYIYISPFEHNAVLRPLHYLREKFEFEIVELAVDKNKMEYDLEAIKYQFQDKKPDCVIVSHASNVCGIVAPLKELFGLAKQKNAITITDMAQTCGLIQVDLTEVQADYVVFAGHKTLYASLGIGGFLIKNGSKLEASIYGGTGVQSALTKQPDTIPEKFEVGSLNTPAIASLYHSIKWLLGENIQQVREIEKQNYEKLYKILKKYANIRMYGLSTHSVGIISCTFEGLSPDNVERILAERNVAVRTGLHCAPNAHKFLGTFPAGTVRFSVSYFTTDEDFAQLEEALDYIEENS